MAIDPVTAKALADVAQNSNPAAMAGSAILGGIQLVGGYRNLAKANKMADPSFMSGAGEIQQQKARYGKLYDTGISTGQEDLMREKFRSNISGLQQKFRETARQGSNVFSRLAGLNVNEGERAIMEADIQQRNMGLRGLGSTAESLTNIAMRDIGKKKDDKRRAIAAAGAAISRGWENLGSAVNFMGMTRTGKGGGQGESQGGVSAGNITNYGETTPMTMNEWFDAGTPAMTVKTQDAYYSPEYVQPGAAQNPYGFYPSKPNLNIYSPKEFNSGYTPNSILFNK